MGMEEMGAGWTSRSGDVTRWGCGWVRWDLSGGGGVVAVWWSEVMDQGPGEGLCGWDVRLRLVSREGGGVGGGQ